MVKRLKPNCLFLMEIKCNSKIISRIRNLLGFEYWERLDPMCVAGGFLLLWNKKLDIQVSMKNVRVMECVVDEKSMPEGWRTFFRHGSPYHRDNNEF